MELEGEAGVGVGYDAGTTDAGVRTEGPQDAAATPGGEGGSGQ